MIVLASFANEMEAQLLSSQLIEAGIECKLEDDRTEGYRILVFEDDLSEAREIFVARALDEDDYTSGIGDDDEIDLDSFSLEE